MHYFVQLDDNDLWSALKVWASHPDTVLSVLSQGMVHRRLFKIEISDQKVEEEKVAHQLRSYMSRYKISKNEARYFIAVDSIATDMYNKEDDSIGILYKNGNVKDISKASDMLNIELL